ncbi:ARM repeat-containing protein [Aspergillus campestris IBT 28561]|uniref:ARM repeat-containing protein n=1 Tax=Aspergillus campestris (strain IBT 28561) TaxID=1392248 RepID=A0A2I1D343_ASPC2|nr:ARM repeat-containing protein [Aspergillus campestris IBT 28561]PKY04285.1 ARM repeat-containing protein [Aspergillus campestris IBT 28561]
MASMVELPGESNPLTVQNVLSALVQAASSTQQQVQTGGQQLQNWEKQEKYYTYLQDVFLDHSVPVEVRYLSIIQLKNGIDKYWRKTATNAIKKDEKEQIKTRALQAGIVEPAPLLALHNALMIAKIMRQEFPHDWADGISSLIAFLRASTEPGANPLQLSRTLVIILQIIKELSTARLQRTRVHLQSVSPEIFHILGSIYVDKVNNWVSMLEQGNADEGTVLQLLEQSLVSLKVVRRLIISGFEHPNRDSEVRNFWLLTHNHFSRFLSFINGSVPMSEQTHRAVEKHLLQLSKLHVDMAKDRAASFALLPESITLVQSYWTLVVQLAENYSQLGESESEGKSLMEKTGLRALLLIRACSKMAFNPAQTFKYQTPEDKEEKRQSIELIKGQLFTHDFVVNVMELLVTQFFRFRKSDFQEWEEDPEEWERREEDIAEAWEFSIRSCSEKLFLDLVIHFKDLLIPRLLNVFYSFASPESRDVLLKDSLYSAIGLAAASLEQHLDFNSFLENTLVPEVQIQEEGYNLLRRRIAILLGQWVPVKFDQLNRDAIYQIFQHLLGQQDPLNDLVVRITAGRQLKYVMEPFEFTPAGFLPYAPAILRDLMSLVQEVDLSETKMGLLDTVRTAVIKMEDHINPFSDQILSLLPPLWESSGEEHLMKQAILTLLSSLINSLKQDSIRYHSLILPLIKNSVEPGSETIIYLLDEALDLWGAILTQTPAPASPEILSLLPALYPIFEAATDSVPQALQIAESYIYLAPQEVLSDGVRFHLLASFEALLKSTTRQRLGIVPRLVELMLRGADISTPPPNKEATYNTIARSLIDSSFLASLLDGLHAAHEASQSTGPNRKQTSVYGVVETDYFSVLARLALASPPILVSALSATTDPSSPALPWLLSEWFLHYDNIGSVTQKKLHALALTNLLALLPDPYYSPLLLSHLQSYLSTWTNIITELADDTSDPNAKQDYLVNWSTPEHQSPENDPPETIRRRDWDNADPLHSIDMQAFVRERLHALVASCGGESRFQEEWLVNVDGDVVGGFVGLGLF